MDFKEWLEEAKKDETIKSEHRSSFNYYGSQEKELWEIIFNAGRTQIELKDLVSSKEIEDVGKSVEFLGCDKCSLHPEDEVCLEQCLHNNHNSVGSPSLFKVIPKIKENKNEMVSR